MCRLSGNYRCNHARSCRSQDKISIHFAPLIPMWRLMEMIVMVVDPLAALPILVADVLAFSPFIVMNVMLVMIVVVIAVVIVMILRNRGAEAKRKPNGRRN